jgi:hypothetical protein
MLRPAPTDRTATIVAVGRFLGMRLHRLALAGLLVSATALALPTSGSAATGKTTAKAKKPACTVKHAKTIASSPYGRLLVTHREEDELYGESTELYACRTGRAPVQLVATEPGDSITLSHVVFTPNYVGFAASSYSSACSKYQPGAPECSWVNVSSFNTRTGRVRAGASSAADALVVTAHGWLAWVTPADASGSRSAITSDRGGKHMLAQGAIAPGSLTLTATTVSWTRGGVPESAPFS